MENPTARTISPALTRHSYWLLVLLPLLMPASLALRDWSGMSTLFAWMPLVVLYGVLPLLDMLIGRDAVNPDLGKGGTYPDVLIPVAAAFVFLPVLAWSVWVAGKKGRALPWIWHELTTWWLISLCMALLAAYFAGMTGLVVFLCQGLAAIALLEVINYIEHYGLRREMVREGRYEPPAIRHSWNGDFWLSNIILIQLQRHPDHHVHPGRPFTQLQSIGQAPQLPLGYAALSVIAFIPPLWRKLIHPRLLQER